MKKQFSAIALLTKVRPGKHRWVYFPPIIFWIFLTHSGGHPPGLSVWVPVGILALHIAFPTQVGWGLVLVVYIAFIALVSKLFLGSPSYSSIVGQAVTQGGVISLLVGYAIVLYMFRPQAISSTATNGGVIR